MLDSLRQVAFLVRDLPEAAELYRKALGTIPCRTGNLFQHGLANMVLPAGQGTFIELLQPISADSNAGRYLNRRGEAPYMLIFETRKFNELIHRLKSMDVRITVKNKEVGHRSVFMHPDSANGAFLKIIEMKDSAHPWPATGPSWSAEETKPLTRQLRQSAILVRDLNQATQRWEEMFGLKTTQRFEVSFTDLEIAVIPLEGLTTFIELAQPTSSGATSARFLERYGEGIYLTIYEIEDSLAMDRYLQGQGIQFTSSRVTANYTNLGFNRIWLHPRTMKGAFTQLSQVLHPENPWPPAGDSWYQ